MFGQAMNPIIRADGSPKFAMISTLAGAVINTILDPIFIFVFKLGHDGRRRGHGHRSGGHRRSGRPVSSAHEDHPAPQGRLCSLPLLLRLHALFGRHQLSLPDQPRGSMAAINNMLRKYGALDPVFGQEQFAQIPMAVVGIVMKFFPDRHFHRGRHGGWLHSRGGLQHGR